MVMYANFNVNDPALRDVRVRQAIACAIDKAGVDAMRCGAGRLCRRRRCCRTDTGLRRDDAVLPQYPHDVERAIRSCWTRLDSSRTRTACGCALR
jgi:peptide/nickel transport system substrate-binding protein